jgi:plastocyanin
MTRRSLFFLPLLTVALAATAGLTSVRTVGGSIVGTVDVTGVASHGGAVVYLLQVPGAFTPAPARMDQQKMEFLPHVLPIVVGTTVTFANSDPVPHVVFSGDFEKLVFPPQRPGETRQHAFDKCAKAPCVYTILCPTHTEMEGFVVVLQNPYFAVSDKDGRYTIDNVPEGKYTVGIWHPSLKGRTEPVSVTSAGPVTLDFTLTK